MHDFIIILAFFTMVLAPCFVALHAVLGEEDLTLGYAASYRYAKAWLIDTLRI